jgi:mRNA-degrading endonuclease YafQ of YafQ-DinJ toxin-antitoxin module
MKFEFVETSIFEKELKRLSKKHKSIKEDIRNLMNTIEEIQISV